MWQVMEVGNLTGLPRCAGLMPEYCVPPDQPPCTTDPAFCSDCSTCLDPRDMQKGWPTLEDTRLLLPWFLKAAPSADCAKGGRGVYTDQIETDARSGDIVGLAGEGEVTSSFRAFSTLLSRQSDFISALRATRSLVQHAQDKLNAARVHTSTQTPRNTSIWLRVIQLSVDLEQLSCIECSMRAF